MNRSSLPPWRVRSCTSEQDRERAMAVRFAVFVDEQQVPPELEPDEYDADALHFIAEIIETGEVIGTARIVTKENRTAKIGRVAVVQKARGSGVGDSMMRAVLDTAQGTGHTSALLDAQLQVIPFYERLGFIAEGPVFDDAGIAHRRMTRSLTSRDL